MVNQERATILHLITGLEIGGAETTLDKLVRHMNRDRFQNVVVSMTGPGKFASNLAEFGVPVLSLDMKRGWPDVRGLMRLIKLVRQVAPTILQTWLYHADFIGLIAGSIARVPATVWNIRCSDMDMSYYSLQSRMVLRLLARLSPLPAATVTNSVVAQEIHERLGYRPKSWHVIPNGFETEEYRPNPAVRAEMRRALGVDDDAILIGLPARYDPVKDHANFFAAAGMVARNNAAVRFVGIGNRVEAGNAALQEQVSRNGLDGKAILLGERQDMPRLLNALDIVALSSAFGEGFPNVLGEAMATGIPCVTTNVGDAAMIVGDTGFAVPPRDPAAFAAAFERLIAMGKEGRAALGAAARRRVLENYSLDATVREYERFFDGLIDDTKRVAA